VEAEAIGQHRLLDRMLDGLRDRCDESAEHQVVAVVSHAGLPTECESVRGKLSRNSPVGSSCSLSLRSRASVGGGNASVSRCGLLSASKLVEMPLKYGRSRSHS